MIHVTVYSRADCHLCDQALADLNTLQAEFPHKVQVVDVDSTPQLRKAFGEEVPVVEVGPYRLKAPLTRQELHMTLSAVRDRQRHIDEIENAPSVSPPVWTSADAFSDWFARHYLAVFNLFIFIYLGLPILAPVLMNAGMTRPANLIYRGYGLVCHQLAYRSFFLFGDQPVYPRQQAVPAGLQSFNQATGLSEAATGEDQWAARGYVGNEQVGYKMALCSRDISIYGAILAFGLLYSLTGRRLPPLPWYLWVLIGLVPVGVDGVSQLLSQPPFEFIPFRESSPFLRSFTGALFGFATAWFGYPLVEESMADARQIMAQKRLRVEKAALKKPQT